MKKKLLPSAVLLVLVAWLVAAATQHQLTLSTLRKGGSMLLSEALLGLDSMIASVALIKRWLPEERQDVALRQVNNLGIAVRVILMGAGPFLLEIAPWLVPLSGVLILAAALQTLKIEEEGATAASRLRRFLRRIVGTIVKGARARSLRKVATRFIFTGTIMAALGILVFTNLDNMAAIIALSGGNWLLIALGIIFNLVFPYLGSQQIKKAMDRYRWARYIAATVLAVLAAYIVASWWQNAAVIWEVSLFVISQAVVACTIFWLHRHDVIRWLHSHGRS